MPAIFKAEGSQEEGPKQDAPDDTAAVADEPSEILAA